MRPTSSHWPDGAPWSSSTSATEVARTRCPLTARSGSRPAQYLVVAIADDVYVDRSQGLGVRSPACEEVHDQHSVEMPFGRPGHNLPESWAWFAVGVARARVEPNPTEPRSVAPPSLVPPAVGAVRRVVGRVEVLRRHQTLVVASALGRHERGPRRSSSGATLHVLRPAEDAELVALEIEDRRERVRRLAQARVFCMKGWDRDRNLRPGEGGLRRNRW